MTLFREEAGERTRREQFDAVLLDSSSIGLRSMVETAEEIANQRMEKY